MQILKRRVIYLAFIWYEPIMDHLIDFISSPNSLEL